MFSTVDKAAPGSRNALVGLFSRLRTSQGQAESLPIYRNLLDLGELVQTPWGAKLASSHRLCDEVLRDKSWLVADRAWRERQGAGTRWNSPSSVQMAQMISLLNPPHHSHMRRAVGDAFHRTSLSKLSNVIKDLVAGLLDDFMDRLHDEPSDFVTLVSEKLPIMTIGRWMGIPSADYEFLRTATHDQVYTQELFPTSTELAVSDAATARLQTYFADLIEERRKRPGDDLVSSWIRTSDAREADLASTDAVVHSLAVFMVLAALETTSYLLANVVRLLLEHPFEFQLLQEHPELIPEAVEEAIRFDAPIHLLSRVAATDTELAGRPIAAGEMVQLLIGAAHHDPTRYQEPDRFSLTRRRSGQPGRDFPAQLSYHFGFGAGMHYCLGNVIARMEATVLITEMLRRSTHLQIDSPPEWAPRIAFRRITSLPLKSL